VEESPEVSKDVGIDILGVVDRSFDLVEGRRVNERSTWDGTRSDRDEERVTDDLRHLRELKGKKLAR